MSNRDKNGRFASKTSKPKTDRLRNIEVDVNRHGVAIAIAIDNIVKRLTAIEASVAVIRSGATFMQQLEALPPKVVDMPDTPRTEAQGWFAPSQERMDSIAVGLQPGDYCDASKEVADELTAIGFKWVDKDRTKDSYIAWVDKNNEMLNTPCKEDTHIDRATFLSRARVTAAELGLTPEPAKDAEVERELKVGDWIYLTEAHTFDRFRHTVTQATQVISGCPVFKHPESPTGEGMWRFATDSEIQQHQADLAAKEREEKVKRLKWGVRVNTPIGEGICVQITGEALALVSVKDMGHYSWFKADQLTIID